MNFTLRRAASRNMLLLLVLSFAFSMFILPREAAASKPDTTWSVSFTLNMSKAVNDHIFRPDSDFVFLVMQGLQPVKLVPNPGNIYTGNFYDVLDSATTYTYQFRINDSVYESVSRSFTSQPGVVSITAWWNNDPLVVTTFIVNMKYAEQYGLFNPLSDSVSIVGTMNNQNGSPKMKRMGNTLDYTYSDSILFPGSVQQYKYRINQGDSASGQLELLFQPNRIVRIPDTLVTVASDFNNFNPAKRLMTFNCNMGYYVQTNTYDPSADYLDVAGNFNGMGANDVLFDTDGDSVFTLGLYLDTAWISQGPLQFKFRINGSSESTELQGMANRTYAFHDTVSNNPNIYDCWFNNLNPAIPTPPWAYNVDIQGILVIKKFLSGIYSYANVNGIPEGISTYRWLRSANSLGTDALPIDSATDITYTIDTLDIGKWLVFEVTPKAVSGDSATGIPVRVVTSGSISEWNIGIGENSGLITRVYPNPARDFITVESVKEIERVELINYLNQKVLFQDDIGSKSARLSISNLLPGIYLLKAMTKSGEWGIMRIVSF